MKTTTSLVFGRTLLALALAVVALFAGGCYSRSVKYGDLEVNSVGLFLDRQVVAEAEKTRDTVKLKYSASDRVDPTLPAVVDAAVKAAVEGAVKGAKPVK